METSRTCTISHHNSAHNLVFSPKYKHQYPDSDQDGLRTSPSLAQRVPRTECRIRQSTSFPNRSFIAQVLLTFIPGAFTWPVLSTLGFGAAGIRAGLSPAPLIQFNQLVHPRFIRRHSSILHLSNRYQQLLRYLLKRQSW